MMKAEAVSRSGERRRWPNRVKEGIDMPYLLSQVGSDRPPPDRLPDPLLV